MACRARGIRVKALGRHSGPGAGKIRVLPYDSLCAPCAGQPRPHAVTERTTPVMSTLMHFEGAAMRRVDPAAQAASHQPPHCGRSCPFCALGGMDRSLDHAELDKLSALLTYGDAYEGPADEDLIVVAPRLENYRVALGLEGHRHCAQLWHGDSPCGTRDRVPSDREVGCDGALMGGAKGLAAQDLQACAALLHDRMTESVLLARDEAVTCSTRSKAPRWSTWTCWAVAGLRWKRPT